MSAWKKALFAALAAGLVLALVEGVLSFISSVRAGLSVERMREEVHTRHDPELGWVNLPDFTHPALYGKGRSYTTNSQGFRSRDGDYTPKVPEDRYRIIALGDSFTMGYGVDDTQTYAAQLQALVPRSQVINMGLGGYGIGQDYLWYQRDGKKLETDLLLFAFIAHDFERMIQSEFMGYAKPRMALEDGQLVATNVPVPANTGSRNIGAGMREFLQKLALGRALGRVVQALRPASPKHEEYVGFEPVAAAIFRDLQQYSRQAGQDFVLVYLPTNYGLIAPPSKPLAWLREHARDEGLTFIDLTPAFEALSPRELARMYIPRDPHYSAEGNRFVAETLVRELSARLPRFAAALGAPGGLPEAAPAAAPLDADAGVDAAAADAAAPSHTAQ